jgi:hypothetical protein
VFALNLIRRKFAKNPIDLIRRKFSIDAGRRPGTPVPRGYDFETISLAALETRHSPFAPNARSRIPRKACEIKHVRRSAGAL